MTLPQLLTLFIIMQGTYSLVLLGAVIFYACFAWQKSRTQQIRILFLSLSHLLLIFATSMTLWYRFYPNGHVWYYIVFVAYCLSDWFLLRLWVQVIKINKTP